MGPQLMQSKECCWLSYNYVGIYDKSIRNIIWLEQMVHNHLRWTLIIFNYNNNKQDLMNIWMMYDNDKMVCRHELIIHILQVISFVANAKNLKILRNGQIVFVKVIVNIIDYLVQLCYTIHYHAQYFIFGGFVFLPLSRPYLRAEYGSNNGQLQVNVDVRLKDLYFNGYKKNKHDHEQVVILSRVLASDLNVGFHKFTTRFL